MRHAMIHSVTDTDVESLPAVRCCPSSKCGEHDGVYIGMSGTSTHTLKSGESVPSQYVICCLCALKGPYSESEVAAIKAWNALPRFWRLPERKLLGNWIYSKTGFVIPWIANWDHRFCWKMPPWGWKLYREWVRIMGVRRSVLESVYTGTTLQAWTVLEMLEMRGIGPGKELRNIKKRLIGERICALDWVIEEVRKNGRCNPGS